MYGSLSLTMMISITSRLPFSIMRSLCYTDSHVCTVYLQFWVSESLHDDFDHIQTTFWCNDTKSLQGSLPYLNIRMYICTQIYIHVRHMHVRTCTQVYLGTWISVKCIYACMYVHAHTSLPWDLDQCKAYICMYVRTCTHKYTLGSGSMLGICAPSVT